MPRLWKNLVLFFVISMFYNTGFSDNQPRFRQDIYDRWHKKICAASDINSIDLNPDFQSQLQIYKLKKKTDKISAQEIEKITKSQVTSNLHHGYSFGICDDQTTAWGVSTPSPVFFEIKEDKIFLPSKDLDRLCTNFYVNYAAFDKGKSKLLAPKSHIIEITKDLQGFISLTCESKTFQNQGNVLWAILNTHPIQNQTPPENALLNTEVNEENLLIWINKLRQNENLPTLISQLNIKDSAKHLIESMTIQHNRQTINKEKKILAKQNIKLLGENRVQGKSLKELAFLLWNSPRHRDLLLDSNANIGGIAVQQRNEQYFMVIVMGKK